MNIVKKLILICVVTSGIDHEIVAMDREKVPSVIGDGRGYPTATTTTNSSQSLGYGTPPSQCLTGNATPNGTPEKPTSSAQPTPFKKRPETTHDGECVSWDHVKKTDATLKDLATKLYNKLIENTASDTQIMQPAQELIRLLTQIRDSLTNVGTDRDETEQELELIIETLKAYQEDSSNESLKANVLKVLNPYAIETTEGAAAVAVTE